MGYSDLIIDDCLNENSLDIFKFFTKLGILPNELTFEIACINNYNLVFDECISKYKFIPNKNTLDKVLSNYNNKSNEIIHKILCYKIIPDKESLDCLLKSHCNIDIIEILIKFGLILTFNDIIKLLKVNLIINNLERFNISYDR